MISKETRDLFAAARGDAAAPRAKAAVWQSLESELGLVVPAALGAQAATVSVAKASTAKASLGVASLKAALVGGGIGSIVTAAVLVFAVPTLRPVLGHEEPAMVTHGSAPEQRSSLRGAVPLAAPPAPAGSDRVSTPAAAPVDALAREVALVVDARQALLEGDAERALTLARRARSLRGQLAREALTLEVRALRGAGRDAEADRAEIELRVAHPLDR